MWKKAIKKRHYFSEIDVNIWLDVLPFVPRRQLAEIVSQSDDYDFASILQYFLNRVGQIAFGNLLVSVNDENSMPIVGVLKEFGESIETYLPDGPMPGNIRDFQSITLRFILLIISVAKKMLRKRKTIPT
jgi:hypothetical protein